MYGAVDIGGTKTLVAVFANDGSLIEQQRFATPDKYDDFVMELAKAVDNLSTKDFQRTVVAIPGLIDRPHGVGVAFGNLTWQNVPLRADVEKIMHCPIELENDAKLAGLSEAIALGDEFRKVLYLTVSTGINCGLVIDGKIDPDFRDMEPGQMLLEHDDQLVRWEDFASGRAIYEKFGKKASDITEPGVWYEIARNLAVGINTLIATLDPDVIVIGGGVGTHLNKFKDRLEEELRIYENPLTPVPPIRQAQRAEEAVIYGCYELARAEHAKVT
jgi:predicted NBD/HSP70 family sugar kinase